MQFEPFSLRLLPAQTAPVSTSAHLTRWGTVHTMLETCIRFLPQIRRFSTVTIRLDQASDDVEERVPELTSDTEDETHRFADLSVPLRLGRAFTLLPVDIIRPYRPFVANVSISLDQFFADDEDEPIPELVPDSDDETAGDSEPPTPFRIRNARNRIAVV